MRVSLRAARLSAISLVLVFAVACTVAPSVSQPIGTVEALEARVQTLSGQLHELEAVVVAAPVSMAEPIVLAASEPATQEAEAEPTAEPASPAPPRIFPTRTPRPLTAADAAPCAVGQIKANRNSHIYHVPGGGSYARTRANVLCFATEAEAQAAGYRRARN